MDTEINDGEMKKRLAERFKQLPKVVQDAITSADIEKRLRELADTHKLHIDQWQLLENEVMLTLLGFQEPEDLSADLAKDLEVGEDVARALAADVSRIVFEPIRAQLEQQLDAPGTQGGGEAADDITRSRTFTQAVQQPAAVAPATPPPAPPEGHVVRAPISSSYAAQQASHERKTVEGDPYREPVA